MLTWIFYKILILSLVGSSLFILLALIKPVTKKIFSPSWSYYLTLITIVTFIFPYGMILPKSQQSLVNVQQFMDAKNTVINNNLISTTNIIRPSTEKLEPTSTGITAPKGTNYKIPAMKGTAGVNFNVIKANAWILWIFGMSITIIFQLVRVNQFKKKLKAASQPIENQELKDLFYFCCDKLGINKNILIRVSSEIGTAMATGIFKPTITIPKEEFDLDTLRMIFIHELMHYKRKDLWVKLISFIAVSLHWFNPVIYLINKELNKQCELSCDWQIVKDMNSDEKQSYGLAIINVLNDSIDRKIALGAGMSASSKTQLKERLYMIKSGKKPKVAITLLAIILAGLVTIMAGFTSNTLVGAKENKTSKDFAVMVKENGLWAVNLSNTSDEIAIDKDGAFKNPSISPDGKYVAYTKDKNLFVAAIDLNQAEQEVIKVAEKVVSYAWTSDINLAYSTEAGGLNGFNVEAKSSSSYMANQVQYDEIVSDKKGTIYAEVYSYYPKNGKQYVDINGLASYNIATGKEKLIVASKPSNEDAKSIDDLGLVPSAAGISKDGAYVYIWCGVHSGSATADGIPLGVYDVKADKFTAFKKEAIFSLKYKDNLAINPLDGRFPILNIGGARDMNINKTLGIVDVTNGSFTPILPTNMISTSSEIYGSTAKGMVTMTPSFSQDGKKLIFAASNASDDMQHWEDIPHNLYTVDMSTKKVEQLTNDNTFNFAPKYSSKGDSVIFAKRIGKDISLWKLQNNKEECITKGLKFDDMDNYVWYYGHYDLGKIMDMYISED